MIRQAVEQAINDNLQQVIIIGAGYDTLGICFAKKYPAINVFELDCGLTRQNKIRALQQFLA